MRAPLTTLVIGFGNDLRQDDALGVCAAEAVQAWRDPRVRGVAVRQLTPELAQAIAQAEQTIFVDARVGAVVEGTAVKPLAPSERVDAPDHACAPETLLALAGLLYGVRPRAWLVTVPGAEFGLGEALSAKAEQGLREALDAIRKLVFS
jgi:hydrogenase maturation protease